MSALLDSAQSLYEDTYERAFHPAHVALRTTTALEMASELDDATLFAAMRPALFRIVAPENGAVHIDGVELVRLFPHCAAACCC